MSAMVTETGNRLTCNHTRPDCLAWFGALPGESVEDTEARSRDEGWITVEAFGSVANLCPRHA